MDITEIVIKGINGRKAIMKIASSIFNRSKEVRLHRVSPAPIRYWSRFHLLRPMSRE